MRRKTVLKPNRNFVILYFPMYFSSLVFDDNQLKCALKWFISIKLNYYIIH